MTLYVLDTDSIVDVLYGIGESITLIQQLNGEGNALCSCSVVIAEVHAGLRPQDQSRGESFLASLSFLSTSADAARRAGQWRYQYARQGRTLATTDCLIAATALEHGATLVTGNLKDFPMPEIAIVPLPRPNRRGG